jgi:hypothetical protein
MDGVEHLCESAIEVNEFNGPNIPSPSGKSKQLH